MLLLKGAADRYHPPVGTTLVMPKKSTNVLDNLTATALMMEYGNIRTEFYITQQLLMITKRKELKF